MFVAMPTVEVFIGSMGVFPMGIPWEWEWTMYNLGTGMGMEITMREWEGMGMSKCGKIPEPQDWHSSCTY